MKALPWRTAKAKFGLSDGGRCVLAEEATRQDGGDFSGACGGGELVGRGEGKIFHDGSGEDKPSSMMILFLRTRA